MNMKFTGEELAIINIALSFIKGQQRQFTVDELPEVTEIAKLLRTAIIDKTLENGDVVKVFTEAEIEFSSAQNVSITKYIKENGWDITQSENVMSVLAKVK